MKYIRTAAICLLSAALLGLSACNKAGQDGSEKNADHDLNNGYVEQQTPETADAGQAVETPEQTPENSDGAAAARRLPDFQLRNAAGEIRTLSSFYGRPLVINFWADWCDPCIEELPTLNRIYVERKAEFDMIAIATQDSKDSEGFWKQNGYEIPIWHDVDGVQQLGLGGVPATFFINAAGELSGFQMGGMTEDAFTTRLATILTAAAEVPPSSPVQ